MSPCSAAFNLRICSRYSLEEAGKPTTGPESPSCVRLPDPSQPPPHHRPVQKIVFWTPSKKDRGQDCRHTKKDSFSPNAGKRVAFWKALNQKNSATAAEEWQKYHFLNRVWKMRKSHFGRTPVIADEENYSPTSTSDEDTSDISITLCDRCAVHI